MNAVTDLTMQDRHAEQIEDWLLAVLRFAVTRNPIDRSSVMSMARAMDCAGQPAQYVAFAFFSRASAELCAAIVNENDPSRTGILRRYIARMDNPRLRRAFEAAVGAQVVTTADKPNPRADLWRGLAVTSRI